MDKELEVFLASVFKEAVSIVSSRSISGGSINQASRLALSNGKTLFLKTNPNPPKNFFLAESSGLKLLAHVENGPRTPRVLNDPKPTDRLLLLEWIEEGPKNRVYYKKLAQALASMHKTESHAFGLDHDNFIGLTPQPNKKSGDGIAFFRDRRLDFQQTLARKRGLISAEVDLKIDEVKDKLPAWLDKNEKPCLLHGDLWSGNFFADSSGEPCLFDPAAYYGHAEADLAMTELFGRLPDVFYDSYHEIHPKHPEHEIRKEIFNLYHLLNHLNLFGASYLSSVVSSLKTILR